MDEILDVRKISKKYQHENGEVLAIKDVSLSVKKGEFVSIIGPSGCGKSTILSVIAGLEEQTSGEIYLEGKNIKDINFSDSINSNIGYMLQKDCLLEWKNILDNVLFGLEIKKIKTVENIIYAENLLKKYGLYEFKEKLPSQLSGGMRQRVALIRTLAIRPKVLLLDEAFSALDYQTRIKVTEDIYRILKKENITTIMVTHDITEAISMADRVIVLSKRPGTVKRICDIKFNIENRTPLSSRNLPEFSKYFNTLWKELGHYEE